MIDNSFSKYNKYRLHSLNNDHKGLNYSSSQRLINNNNINKKKNYSFPYFLNNNNNNLKLPNLGDSFRIENRKNFLNNHNFNNNINSSFLNSRKDISNSSNFSKLRRERVKNILDAPKRLSGYLDYKINKELEMKNMREDFEKRRMMSKMRKRIDDRFKKERSVDDIRFLRDFDEIEEKRQNMRLMREKMFRELKNQELDDLEDSLYIPPIPPPLPPPQFYPNPYPTIIPPPIIMPPMNANNNQAKDSTSDLFKFFIIKKLLDSDDKPSNPNPNPMNYPYMPNPYWFPPPITKKKKKKKKNQSPMPIIIYPPVYEPQKEKRKKETDVTINREGIPFVDPLDQYFKFIDNYKKGNSRQSGNSQSNNDMQDEENGEEGEEN